MMHTTEGYAHRRICIVVIDSEGDQFKEEVKPDNFEVGNNEREEGYVSWSDTDEESEYEGNYQTI